MDEFGMKEEYGCANPQLSYLIVLTGSIVLSCLLGFGIAYVLFGRIICIGS